ncbi:hypothetical protein HQQ80_19070 [Microbacteriaceae bacterium VKM Ac-2855]|nr:hypothetical protein [Microbacteriaceae bacterium VKM Ac-2855]
MTLDITPRQDGTEVRLTEDPVKGLGTLLPTPIMWLILRVRNHETLRRLSHLAEGDAGAAVIPDVIATDTDRQQPAAPRRRLRDAVFIIAATLAAIIASRRIGR